MPEETPATPTPAPAAHASFLSHFARLLPLLHHLGAFVVKAAPIAIQAGVHVSPQAAIAIEAISAIAAAHEEKPVEAQQSETNAE
jgi:hypothetical protein